jgi:hypothetical protein
VRNPFRGAEKHEATGDPARHEAKSMAVDAVTPAAMLPNPFGLAGEGPAGVFDVPQLEIRIPATRAPRQRRASLRIGNLSTAEKAVPVVD